MKTRTNYKMPLFFGWYTINPNNQRNHENTLKLDNFSNKDLDCPYKR